MHVMVSESRSPNSAFRIRHASLSDHARFCHHCLGRLILDSMGSSRASGAIAMVLMIAVMTKVRWKPNLEGGSSRSPRTKKRFERKR